MVGEIDGFTYTSVTLKNFFSCLDITMLREMSEEKGSTPEVKINMIHPLLIESGSKHPKIGNSLKKGGECFCQIYIAICRNINFLYSKT